MKKGETVRGEKYADLWPGNYRAGMWVWLLHRISGVVLSFYIIVHILIISLARLGGSGLFDRILKTFGSPLVIALDLLLVWAVLFHTCNGLRILSLDLGWGLSRQKALFWGMMAVAGGLLLLGIALWAPYLLGRALAQGG